MNLKLITVEATDIQDAWFQCLVNILEHGSKYVIERGPNRGDTRLEFDQVTVNVKQPYSEPYDTMLPQIPVALGIPNPVEPGYVEQYLPYLMTDHVQPHEQYTYGQRIAPQLPHFIEMLRETPNTNQAILQVGRPADHLLEDPPCLRHIDMRVQDGTLIFYPYFRSWDLWGGFPANLAGIAVLQRYMADEIGVKAGPIVASSKGLHIYSYVEELARLRTFSRG